MALYFYCFNSSSGTCIDSSNSEIIFPYLETLFGSRVGAALQTLESEIARRQQGQPSELVKTLIANEWKEMLGPFTRDPAEITWE